MSTELATRANGKLESVSERPSVKPAVDIYENGDEYLLIADLPGADKDELNIHLAESSLTIEANVTSEAREGALSREFGVFNYRRTFDLPKFVDRDKVAAELNAGVLTLHLPKSEAVKPRRIAVQSA